MKGAEAPDLSGPAAAEGPRPAAVRGNDWRRVEVAPLDGFTPSLKASVVIPFYEAPEALALTLAALAGQTYPRRLFEVIAVDDGSDPPLRKPEDTGLDLKILRQEHRGFGAPRARNRGARAASGDFLVFLDCDMMPEAGWLAAHARWHHVLSDVLTLGFRAHVEVDGVDAAAVAGRAGSLAELFSDRPAQRPEWIEFHMARTNELTSTADDIFRIVTSGNLGVGRGFFEGAGGFDESFTQWGAEDTEFGYRAYTRGGLLAPERAAFCWHQGPGASPSEAEMRSLDLQRAKAAHLIAHNGFRRASPGRTFTVPQHAVTLESGEAPAEDVFTAAVRILGDRMHDLAVLIEDRPDGPDFEWLRRQLGPDPRVRFGPPGAALDEFPASPFHITCSAGAALPENMIYTLRSELGGAVSAVLVLEDGARVTISRSWALHRSRRSGRRLAELGAAVSVKAEKMVLDMKPWRPPLTVKGVLRRFRRMVLRVWGPIWTQRWAVRRLYRALLGIRSPRQAWQVAQWAAEAVRGRAQAVFRFALRRTPDSPAADYPLGMEIAVRGERSAAVLAASARVWRVRRIRRRAKRRIDLVLADRPEAAARPPAAGIPAAVLTEAPPQVSVPAFDPQAVNPIGWVREPKYGAGALGPAELLPSGAAERTVEGSDRETLRLLHHLEDTAAFHSGPVERAAALAALAARGVVVHLADQDRGLEPLLGPELYGSMASPRIRGADPGERELISAAMRRAALRGHSLRSRVRQIAAAASLEPPPLTKVSVLAAARRPDLLPALLAAVSSQTYPRLELVLTLCGGGFGPEAEQAAEEMPCPVRVVRTGDNLPIGAVLNQAARASRGVLITVMDDRHLYGPEHIWDLVLAREYSAAELVVKETEFVYLAATDRTLRRSTGPGEDYLDAAALADGALLLSHRRLEEAGGWKRTEDGLEESLAHDVVSAGGRVYRTHGAGMALAAAGRDRPARLDDGYLLAQAEEVRGGWDPAFCGLPPSAVPRLHGEGAAASEPLLRAAADGPRPAAVRGNDWREVEIPPIEEFTPVLGVSVVVPYYEAPEALELTLAALAGQTYPRGLFEVIVVDDGSKTPLERPEGTGLDLKVVRQEDLGFGLARARNTGAGAARRGILVFLDCDMMPEAGWLAAHARWHHVLSDVLTLGFRAHVEVDGLNAAAVSGRGGSLAELFAGRPTERPEWIEFHMERTDGLTSSADDIFRVVTGGNLGVSKEFFEAVGGFDESFTQWGAEDTEFGYRAYTRGGLLAPERAAFCWHQGTGASPSEAEMKSRELQRAKIAHLIAHYGFRGDARGRSFTVPQYAVTLESGNASAEDVFLAAERILSGAVHDLVVRIEDRPDDPDFEWLRRQLDPDPRVGFGSPASALDDFPVSAFHVSAPAGVELLENLVLELRTELEEAASAVLVLEDGARASITRTWALHRSRRSAGSIDRWGARKTAPAGEARSTARAVLRSKRASRRVRKVRSKAARVLYELRRVRSFRQVWGFLRWFAAAAGRRLEGARRYRMMQLRRGFRPGGFLPARRAGRLGGSGAAYPLGAEMIALGPKAGRVFAASTRVRRFFDGRHVDLVLADDPGAAEEAGEASVPSVVLSESPPSFSVPAFDLLTVNPIRWVREPKHGAAALGPPAMLPPGSSARRRVDRSDRRALSQIHHLEDAACFHSGPVERAGALAALAGMGVVVHLADQDPELESLLGAELYGAMADSAVLDASLDRREAISIAMRREALRSHSLPARARQIISAGLPGLPLLADVSILAPTKRPRMVPQVLAAAASQTYPRLELVLALHGAGFDRGARADIEARAGDLPFPVRILAAGEELNLGEVLELASEAAEGTLLTKLDDDDLYSPEHVWDLVLARQYSKAELAAKGAEFVYLAGSDLTLHRFCGKGEAAPKVVSVAGGTLLISRRDLEAAGGWRRAPRGVDTALIEDVRRAGGSVYRTHGFGYVLVRHGSGHTWESEDGYFLRQAESVREGWDPGFAGLDPGAVFPEALRRPDPV